jgi:allantoate deiminase
MPSGALHDTQRMSKVSRVAMIFVQSRDGRSHTPAEFTSIEHAVAGIQVLAAALYKLAY